MTTNTNTTAPTAKCARCGRILRSAASIARGKGAHCARLDRREAAAREAGFKDAAIDKALQLIADHGIVPVRGRRVFAVVSSDGTGRYLTAREACNCPAGLRARHACYHRAAAHMLAA
ncbi:DUF6011 domain-containing protein [Actinomadura opuntiae]|uniref:DUF6011 domain-containing protein n=1 Tax=Actinomadura sp. OS1-43 TaxID=604315 RepID=UPI00255A729B|nr:DUF6011 domain-containing protein [Actinomadura sp. OS1-43]MDL4812770.1 DUF6011 domain-containing protein [Actinomadura sp. OS1-43]